VGFLFTWGSNVTFFWRLGDLVAVVLSWDLLPVDLGISLVLALLWGFDLDLACLDQVLSVIERVLNTVSSAVVCSLFESTSQLVSALISALTSSWMVR
jgi:hypothetical protein